MKLIMLMALSLTLVTTAHADELSSNALQTLLSSKTSLSGDVHSYETVESIYSDAVNNGAKIQNECEIVKSSSPFAKCTLWINYTLGETALQYEVNLPGTTLRSSLIEVARGD